MMPQILWKGFLTLIRRPGVILGAVVVAVLLAGFVYVQNLRSNYYEESARAERLEARVEELEDARRRLEDEHKKTLRSLEERAETLKNHYFP